MTKKVTAEIVGKLTKVPPKTVWCDDFEVESDGKKYFPHAGEKIELYPRMADAEVNAYQTLFNAQEVMEQVKGDDNAAQKTIGALHEATEELRNALADRVVSWTWTDNKGRAMPDPDGKPEAFLKCTMAELIWIVAAIEGETGGDRKNGSSG